MSLWGRLFGRRREAVAPKAACRTSDEDCFPSQSNPEPLCERGYCMVHCSAICRGQPHKPRRRC